MPSPPRHTLDLRARLRAPPFSLRGLWRRREVRLAAVGLVLIAGALVGSAVATLTYALSPAAFAAMAGSGFGRELRVERVRLRLGYVPTVRVEGVEIDGLGSADAAEIELGLRALVHGEVRPRVVRFVGPKLVLQRGPGGEFLPIFQPAGGSGDLSALPAFEAGGGEVRIVQGDKLTAVVRIRSLSLGRFRHASSAPLVLSGNVTGGDGRWHWHPVHLRGDLVHTADSMELLEGWIRADDVAATWFTGRNARARFNYRDGRFEIERLDLRAFGGNWMAAGQLVLRGGMRLELTLRSEGVDFASLLSAADGRGPKTDADLGLLRMRWDPLRVPWRDGPRFDQGEGRGHLQIAGGLLPGTSLLGSLVGLDPAPTPVESFSALVTLRGGRLHSEALRLVTGDYTLEAQGSVGLDKTVALEGRVNLAGDLILPRGAKVLPTVPVTIAGVLPHPEVDAHVSRVPGGGIGAVAGAVGRTGATVVHKVGGALGAAGRKVGGVFRSPKDDATKAASSEATAAGS